MNNRHSKNILNSGKAIKAFLLNPVDKRTFGTFYSVCFSQTITYLRYLKSRNWKLPIEKSENENPLADLAIDILGPLLQSCPGEPFLSFVTDLFGEQNTKIIYSQ